MYSGAGLEVLKTVKECVLQPQSDLTNKVRRILSASFLHCGGKMLD